jgi:sugar phosphate isomerase/epimerase
MQLFLSTTFYGSCRSDLADVFPLIEKFDLDGIELGSTHNYSQDLVNIVKNEYNGRIVTHNFFPPSKNSSFVVNLASENIEVRENSIAHATHCIIEAAKLGAEIYTVHPGFLANPMTSDAKLGNYDFDFSDEKIDRHIAFNFMIHSITKLRKIAIKYGVKLAIETEGSLTKPGVLLMETLSEYDLLFSIFPEDIYLNINLAHSRFAAEAHDFSLREFINRFYEKIVLVEVSHNDGIIDQHSPLVKGSFVFDYFDILPDVPYILEFRNADLGEIEQSIALMRAHHF